MKKRSVNKKTEIIKIKNLNLKLKLKNKAKEAESMDPHQPCKSTPGIHPAPGQPAASSSTLEMPSYSPPSPALSQTL